MTKLSLVLFILTGALQAIPIEHLTDLDGNSLSPIHSKNRELVVFWATWCPECKTKLKGELKELNKLKDIAVWTIGTDKDVARIKHFIEKEAIELPVFLDPNRLLRKSLNVYSVPHWVVYARKAVGQAWEVVDSGAGFEKEKVAKALGIKNL